MDIEAPRLIDQFVRGEAAAIDEIVSHDVVWVSDLCYTLLDECHSTTQAWPTQRPSTRPVQPTVPSRHLPATDQPNERLTG
jgi:hypothetical protein